MSKREFDQANKPTTPPPFSIRFSWPQRTELDRLSQGKPWSAYIKGAVFGRKLHPASARNKYDHQILAKLLAALGKSHISSNISQLAKAANSGSLPVNEDVSKAIMDSARAIEWMRQTLIEGMGLKPHQPENPPEHDHDHDG